MSGDGEDERRALDVEQPTAGSDRHAVGLSGSSSVKGRTGPAAGLSFTARVEAPMASPFAGCGNPSDRSCDEDGRCSSPETSLRGQYGNA